jgi:hypothetical protein
MYSGMHSLKGKFLSSESEDLGWKQSGCQFYSLHINF